MRKIIPSLLFLACLGVVSCEKETVVVNNTLPADTVYIDSLTTDTYVVYMPIPGDIITEGDFQYTVLEDMTVAVTVANIDFSATGTNGVLDVPEITKDVYAVIKDKEVVIKGGLAVSTIAEKLFYNKSVKTVNMPSVKVLEKGAFERCGSLTEVKMPKVEIIKSRAFLNCSLLTDVEMTSVSQIEESAFFNCGALVSVDMPKVKILGDKVFENCTALMNVEIPMLEIIGDGVFLQCEKLSINGSVIFTDTDGVMYARIDGSSAKILNFTKAVTGELIVPLNVTIGGTSYKVTRIGAYAFTNSGLTSVKMPEVKTVGMQAFNYSSNVTDIEMSKVENIEVGAFDGCSGLVTAGMTSVIIIEKEAFWGCSKLEQAVIPVVKFIGAVAFENCGMLTYVDMPKMGCCYQDVNSFDIDGNPLNSFGGTTFWEPSLHVSSCPGSGTIR